MRFLTSAKDVYGQFSGEPWWYRFLIRIRFLLSAIYLLALLGGLGWLGSGIFSDNKLGEDIGFVILTLVLFASQAMLLAGAPQFHRARPIRRRHKVVSLIAGSMAAAALSIGVAATIVSLCKKTINDVPGARSTSWWPLIDLVAVAWGFWLLIFGLLWARRWDKGFSQMYRLLVAGTFAEVLFTVPVDIMVRRRTECYCEEGTFYALIIGATSAVWTFGPGVVLLFLAVRLRHRHRKGVCLHCGYDLRGLTDPRCPECGTPFNPALLQQKATPAQD